MSTAFCNRIGIHTFNARNLEVFLLKPFILIPFHQIVLGLLWQGANTLSKAFCNVYEGGTIEKQCKNAQVMIVYERP